MSAEELKSNFRRIKINTQFQYDSINLHKIKMNFLKNNCERILDIGKGSRIWFNIFKDKQITTLDINQYSDSPDIIDDICNIKRTPFNSYDAIICMSILEHVYAPELAVNNIHKLLKKGGYCFAYTPFLLRYHSPKDLHFQDFFRFTKNGIAYLFKRFSEITIYPFRGKYSTILNLHRQWKKKIEKYFGQHINLSIDRLLRGKGENDQVSGYYIWAIK